MATNGLTPATSKRIPPPQFTAKLSAFDSSYFGLFSRRVLIFKSDAPQKEVTDIFTKALEHLVQKVPVLGGVVRFTENSPTGQPGFKEIVPGEGLFFHVKDLTSKIKYADLEATNFAPRLLPDEELMPITGLLKEEPYDAGEFQLSFIDGGILVSMCVAHVAADGTSDTEILRLLAGFVKGVQQDPKDPSTASLLSVTPQVGLDRTAYLKAKSKNGFKPEEHTAYEILPPGVHHQRRTDTPSEEVKVYRVSADKLVKLKEDLTTSRISTNDALTAVMWRLILVNRIAAGVLLPPGTPKPADQEAGSLPVASDVTESYFAFGTRHVMGVGKHFVGNAAAIRKLVLPLKDVVNNENPEAGLQKAAAGVRAAVNEMDRDRMHSLIEYVESAHHLGSMSFNMITSISTTSVAGTTFFHSESMLESDWGAAFGGSVRRVRCTAAGFCGALSGFLFILPKMADGSTEIQLGLFSKGVEATETDPIFKKYLSI